MQSGCGEKNFLEEKKERSGSGHYREAFAFEPEVNVIALETFEDGGQRHAALDSAVELLRWDIALIFDGDVVPAGELAHGRFEVGVVEVEIAIFPGRDLSDVDVVEGLKMTLRVED